MMTLCSLNAEGQSWPLWVCEGQGGSGRAQAGDAAATYTDDGDRG